MKNLIPLLALFTAQAFGQTVVEQSITRGKVVYEANCATCHGLDGKGGNGAKPLDASPIVLYDTSKQLRIVLDGVGGKGMPAWASKLTDLQIADVITYTKNNWTNRTGAWMTTTTVSTARLRGDGCVDQFFSPLPQPTGTGRVHEVVSPAGKVNVWWCMLPARQGDVANKIYWRMQGYPVHKDDASKLVLVAAAGRIAIASDPISQAWAEVNAARVSVTPGSVKEYEYKQLAWLGCEKLRVTPPPGEPFDTPLSVDYCGAKPIPPAQPPVTAQYIVAPFTGATRRATYPFAAGVRNTTSNGSIAILNGTLPTPVGAPQITEGTTTYCGLIGLPTSVVACKPR